MYLELFTEFGIILVVATGMAFLMRLIRQPLIIGHIFTGIIVGPLVFDLIKTDEVFRLFSDLGIAFLLFSVGLSLNPRVLKDYGRVALLTGVGQVLFTSLAGFVISRALGFDTITSIYVSIALAFSSTIIILKLISDKGDLDKLYAKISIGFLLVQDLIAFALLFFLPILATVGASLGDYLIVFSKTALLIAIVFLLAKFAVSRIHPYLSRSSELLFLFSVTWGLGIAMGFKEFGFPMETGALIAGIALAFLPARHEISAKLSPLRDFFIVIFFVLLGSQINPTGFETFIWPAIILSLLVLIGNPIILMAIMGGLGYRKKTSLETGMTVAQISEFSLILMALGVSLGHVSVEALSIVTLVGIATIFGSTYLILYSNFWYKLLSPALNIFERKKIIEKTEKKFSPEIILFGANRIGYDFVESYRNSGDKLLVIDHDPENISELEESGVSCIFGDASDPDLLENLDCTKTKLVVSTIPDRNTNILILKRTEREHQNIITMAVAHSISNALALYKAGASYVILPHFLGAKLASTLSKELVEDGKDIPKIRNDHILHLRRRLALGHEHPAIEKYR